MVDGVPVSVGVVDGVPVSVGVVVGVPVIDAVDVALAVADTAGYDHVTAYGPTALPAPSSTTYTSGDVTFVRTARRGHDPPAAPGHVALLIAVQPKELRLTGQP